MLVQVFRRLTGCQIGESVVEISRTYAAGFARMIAVDINSLFGGVVEKPQRERCLLLRTARVGREACRSRTSNLVSALLKEGNRGNIRLPVPWLEPK
jgi:hypothetical protein